MGKYFLVLDIGTTGIKGMVFDQDLKPLSKSYHRLNKRFPHKGYVEQNPNELVNKSILAIQKAVKLSGVLAKDIVSMGITNQRETTILWDKKTGKAIYPAIVWEDTRTQKQSRDLGKRYNALVRSKTGLHIDPYFSATKISWILKHVPKAAKLLSEKRLLFGTVDTWVLWNISKEKTHLTDYTNASRTLLFNIKDLSWDKELLEIFNIPPSILPSVKNSRALFGTLRPSILKTSMPIRTMCGDQQSSMFAAGTTIGTTKVTYGTGTFMMQIVGKTFKPNKHFFTTIAATMGKPIYAVENKLDCCGKRVDDLLKKKASLVPIIKEISKKVASEINKLPIKPKRLIVDGGLTQAPTLVGIQSKAAGVPVIKQPIHDGTALGVAKLLKSLN